MSGGECAKLREDFLKLKYTDITRNTYPKLNGYGDNGEDFESMTAVTHLLFTKYVLKLAGICGFCNVNICTNLH